MGMKMAQSAGLCLRDKWRSDRFKVVREIWRHDPAKQHDPRRFWQALPFVVPEREGRETTYAR
jgi:hypothetical protein